MRRGAFIPRLLVPVLVALLAPVSPGAAVFAASSNWARVIDLEKYTEVRVELRDGQSLSGVLAAADSYSLTVRSMGMDEQVPRGQVRRILPPSLQGVR